MPGQSISGQTTPPPPHPDAELLTAFAEQALSATERAGVLEHLALCGDCREVVALALPTDLLAIPTAANAETEASAIPAKSRWSWLSSAHFAWPGLRWAALAAGVAVAAVVLLLHPGKLNQATLPSANQRVAPAADPRIASSPVESSPVASSPVASSPVQQLTTLAKADETRVKPELQMSKKFKAGQAASPLPAQSGMLLAGNKTGSAQADKPSAVPFGGPPAFEPGESAPRTVTESVQVAAAAEAVSVEPSSEDTLLARNPAPAIEKAKPALSEPEVIGQQNNQAAYGAAPAGLQSRNVMSAAKQSPSSNQTLARQRAVNQTLANETLANNVTWTIKTGILQRSLDSGQSWQNALHADRPLLCYAGRGLDIWTGGQAGTLFHSSDNGLTWVRVQPSVKTYGLTSDVTRIDIHDNLRDPVEIVVFTSNHEIWSSADGGRTWNKK
jgi:hypothetical protein